MAKLNLNAIQQYAGKCHTPRQFRRLFEDVRNVIPYRGVVCIASNPMTHRVIQMKDIDYPRQYLGWYLATGMCRKDPLFLESLKTQQPELRSDIMRRLPGQHEQAHLKKVKEFQLDYEIQAVMTDADRGAIFSFILSSEAEGRRYLTPLSELVPFLFRALLNSYRYPLLTDRKKTILLCRAQGMRPNVIASELGITPRTVKMHLEEIVRKLYAEDLVHAVWIAGQIGIIG
jgi:DNA-binding CsgD family transcriptional regulator